MGTQCVLDMMGSGLTCVAAELALRLINEG